MKTVKLISLSAVLTTLVACGGGGDDKPSGNALSGNKHAPSVASVPDQADVLVQEGEGFSISGLAFSDEDNNDVEVRFENGPTWLRWDEGAQQIVGVPEGATDYDGITVLLDDGLHQVEAWTFSLNVNAHPEFIGVALRADYEAKVSRNVAELFAGLEIADADDDKVVLTISNGPDWLRVKDNTLAGVPTREGRYEGVQLFLDDGVKPIMAAELNFTVAAPDIMSWRLAVPWTVSEGDTFMLQAEPKDPNGAALDFLSTVTAEGELVLDIPTSGVDWDEFNVVSTWTHGEYVPLSRWGVDMRTIMGMLDESYQPSSEGMALLLPSYESSAYHALIRSYSQGFELLPGIIDVAAKAVEYSDLMYVSQMFKLAHEDGLLFRLNNALASLPTQKRRFPNDLGSLLKTVDGIRFDDSNLLNNRYWYDMLAEERESILSMRPEQRLGVGTWSLLSPSNIEFGAGLGLVLALSEDNTYKLLSSEQNRTFGAAFNGAPESGVYTSGASGVALLIPHESSTAPESVVFSVPADPVDTSYALQINYGLERAVAYAWAEAFYRAELTEVTLISSAPHEVLLRLNPEANGMRAASAELRFEIEAEGDGVALSSVGVEERADVMLQKNAAISSPVVFDPLKFDLVVAMPDETGNVRRQRQVRLDLYDNYLVRQKTPSGEEILPWSWSYDEDAFVFTFSHTQNNNLFYEVKLLDQAADGRFELGDEGISYVYGVQATVRDDQLVTESFPAQAALFPKSTCESGACDAKSLMLADMLWTKKQLGQGRPSSASGWMYLTTASHQRPNGFYHLSYSNGSERCKESSRPCYVVDERRKLTITGNTGVLYWSEDNDGVESNDLRFAIDVKGNNRLFLTDDGLVHYNGKSLLGDPALANSKLNGEPPAEGE